MSIKGYEYYNEYNKNHLPQKLKDVMAYFINNIPKNFDLFTTYNKQGSEISNSYGLILSAWIEPYNDYEFYILNNIFHLSINNANKSSWFSSPFYEIPHLPLSDYIFRNYRNRKILDFYTEGIDKWEATIEDYYSIHKMIYDDIFTVVMSNRYKWSNLLKSCILEFNPLWNVDGTETTIRELLQTGTVANEKRGDDIISQRIVGSNAKTGTETNTKTGTESNVKNGSETDTEGGTERRATTGTNTNIESRTTTESTSFYDAVKNVNTPNETNSTTFGKTNTHGYANVTDTKTNNLTDTLTHNVTDNETRTIDTDTAYNNDDTMTRNLADNERITLTRQGNIGVTTTTKLLTEFREYVNYNLIDVIARDIVNSITEGVY